MSFLPHNLHARYFSFAVDGAPDNSNHGSIEIVFCLFLSLSDLLSYEIFLAPVKGFLFV